MTAVLSQRMKDLLLKGFPADIDSPYSNGKMKFDQITISNTNGSAGGVKVTFSWHGTVTHWMRVEGIKFENDMTLTLNGLTGDQGVDIGV